MSTPTPDQRRAMVKLCALAFAAAHSPDPNDVDWGQVVAEAFWDTVHEGEHDDPDTAQLVDELALELEREVAGRDLYEHVHTLANTSA